MSRITAEYCDLKVSYDLFKKQHAAKELERNEGTSLFGWDILQSSAAFERKKRNRFRQLQQQLQTESQNQVYKKVGCKQRAKFILSLEISQFDEQLWTRH